MLTIGKEQQQRQARNQQCPASPTRLHLPPHATPCERNPKVEQRKGGIERDCGAEATRHEVRRRPRRLGGQGKECGDQVQPRLARREGAPRNQRQHGEQRGEREERRGRGWFNAHDHREHEQQDGRRVHDASAEPGEWAPQPFGHERHERV